MTESFFYSGRKIIEDLNVTPLDQIIFSNYTQDYFMFYQSGIRFTKEMLFLCYNSEISDEFNDWQDCDIIEICPWENIISFDRYNGPDVIRSVSQNEIISWLTSLEDKDLSFPFFRFTKKNFVIFMEGRPFSHRSRISRRKQETIYQNLILEIKKIVKQPLSISTSVCIDIFTTQKDELADIDRIVQPILDSFQGTLYINDNQITNLHPRILNMENPFTVLEHSTNPMSLSSVENIPVGSFYPLTKNVRDYYVIRFSVQ